MTQALLLIDIQNDYFPGGKMELEGSVEAARAAGKLLHVFRRDGHPVVHIQHVAVRPGATFFLPETDGVRIHESVSPLESEMVIQKHFPNSFRETTLLEFLRTAKVEQLVVAGMMTHRCVDSTVRAAFDLGFGVTLIKDACATRALPFEESTIPAANVQAAFLAALDGVFARVQSAGAYIGDETLDIAGW